MKRMITGIISVILVLMMLAASLAYAEQDNAGYGTPAEREMKEMTAYSFDEDLLHYISSVTEGSYMISPLSFRYALGLLLAGAEGDTKIELTKALGIFAEEEWETLCNAFNRFIVSYAGGVQKEIDEYEENKRRGWIPADSTAPARALRVANSVWMQEGIPCGFSDGYCEKVGKTYAAEEFTFADGNAAERINGWVKEKTEGLIPSIVPADFSAPAVVLMNALYFKDSWVEEFPDYLTNEGDFTSKDGTVIRKDFMRNEDHFNYYEDEDTQLVVIPMKGGVRMAFVLGNARGFAGKIAAAERVKVKVTIPKIDLETSFGSGELVNFLKARGAKLAFDPDKADFSAMLDYPVWVSDIIQKTRIKTDETGVEAAAVTAMPLSGAGMPVPEKPKVFTADRPFSFFIYTVIDDAPCVMFAGEIVD